MPIRINLLAEAQAAEDLRRRDPVKRGIWCGGFLIFCVVLWIGWLQVDVFRAVSTLKHHEARWTSLEESFKKVTDNEKKVRDIDGKIAALNRLSTNRFLWGSVLNTLQTTMVDQIQLTRLKTEQIIVPIDERKAITNGNKIIPRVPPAAVEKISLTIDARDWNPGETTYNKFKETLSNSEYFLNHLRRRDGFVFSGTLSAPAQDPGDPGRSFVSFTLESRFPEVRRNE
jgi:hypothetical protein